MTRAIYIVSAYIVDANGTFNPVSGYPKTFDSRSYNHDLDKTFRRAQGEFSDTWGAMCKRDDRLMQTVILTDATGFQLDRKSVGAVPDAPEPQPEPEE